MSFKFLYSFMIIKMFKKFFLSLLPLSLTALSFASAVWNFDYTFTCSSSSNCVLPNWDSAVFFDECVNWSDLDIVSNNSSPVDCAPAFIYSSSLGSTPWKSSGLYFVDWREYNLSSLWYICWFKLRWDVCESFPVTMSIKRVNYTPPLLPGGAKALSGAVTNLTNSVTEFIPYIVYIWLWILVVCIWFVSIKRLINWVRAKIFSSFK